MHSYPLLTVLSRDRSWNCRFPFTGRSPFLASPQRGRLANASWPNRVQHCFVYGLVFRFRLLSTPHLYDAVTFSYGQASAPVRMGLTPFCWCVLSGAPFLPLRGTGPLGRMIDAKHLLTEYSDIPSSGIIPSRGSKLAPRLRFIWPRTRNIKSVARCRADLSLPGRARRASEVSLRPASR